MRKLCKHCGLSEDEHHEYEAVMPVGCVCDPGEWGDNVTDICAEYDGDGTTVCTTCEHDMECHAEKKADANQMELIS